MASRTQRRTSRVGRAGLLALCLVAVGGSAILAYWSRAEPDPAHRLPTAPVLRVSLDATVVEGGEVDSAEKTLIECELENVSFRNAGTQLQASGASVIIELVPEGTIVRQGQVLCRLDDSEYEEMVRQQEIELQEDVAEYNAAKLELETLEIQLSEYRDGLFAQEQEMRLGQIAMAQADVGRQRDRLAWSERMYEIGYIPLSRLTAEKNLLLQTQIALNQAMIGYNNLIRYVAPKTILTMKAQIDGARARLRAHESRVERDREQLAMYQEQVEHCTIRAPHDGFLIYAHDDDDEARIELGASVRENQDLFYLPDLSQMEIRAELHESVVTRVRVGMPAQVRVDALPQALIEGEVVAVAPLPKSPRNRRDSGEVKNYESRIALHSVPEGLMPGMTARVEILTDRRPEALVIPPDALAIEDGRDVCYVVGPQGIERRAVDVGAYHPQMIEVTAGLAEGEQVVVAPDRIDPDMVIVAPETSPAPRPDAAATLAAL